MKVKYPLIFLSLSLLLSVAGYSQSANKFQPGLLIPASGLALYTPGQMNSGKHGFHIRRSSKRGYVPIKKVAPAKHVSMLKRAPKQEHLALEYQGTNMGFEVRRYLHRHKQLPKQAEPSSFSSSSGKSPASGYYLGTDIFDQFAESPLPGFIPDYSTTGMFGSVADKNKTYLTFQNAFGARLELGYQSLKQYGMVFDFSFKAGLQYVENTPEFHTGTLLSDQPFGAVREQGALLLPTILCSARIGWSE
jgi:hypothetical protein